MTIIDISNSVLNISARGKTLSDIILTLYLFVKMLHFYRE